MIKVTQLVGKTVKTVNFVERVNAEQYIAKTVKQLPVKSARAKVVGKREMALFELVDGTVHEFSIFTEAK